MSQRKILLYTFLFSAIQCFADYSDHGRPWDADDNYDSSHGIWFALFILGIIIVVAIYGFAKHIWENHKSEVKDGFGIVAFFGGCILLFLLGKSCSESRPKDNGNAVNVHQIQQTKQQPAQQYQPQPRQPELRYRTEYYNDICSYCSGTGYITCRFCNGTGHLTANCRECNGKGYTEFTMWVSGNLYEGGHNVTSHLSCLKCGGKGTETAPCPHCHLIGTKNNSFINGNTCSTCNGSGRITKSRQVPYYQ